MTLKANLKSARDSIQKKDYENAKKYALKALEFDGINYNANVFLGLACLELNQLDEAEQAYKAAVDANPEQILAWQGLAQYYERSRDNAKYAETLERLADVFNKDETSAKCTETLLKLLTYRRSLGQREDLIHCLHLFLPNSPFASHLPSDTLPYIVELSELVEAEEVNVITKEVGRRRMRLDPSGTSREQMENEVVRTVWMKSEVSAISTPCNTAFERLANQLPELYDEILRHRNTDDSLRRSTESKLVCFKYKLLLSTSATDTSRVSQARSLLQMVEGITLISIPDKLAWDIYANTRDYENLDGYIEIVKKIEELFPRSEESRLGRCWRLYFDIDSLRSHEDEGDSTDDVTEEALVDGMLDSFTSLSSSIFAHRVISSLHMRLADYKNVIDVCESALLLVKRWQTQFQVSLSAVELSFNLTLGTALVNYFAPKYHARATKILDRVLSVTSLPSLQLSQSLLGKATIAESAELWEDALKLYERILKIPSSEPDKETQRIEVVAKEGLAWTSFKSGHEEQGIEMLKEVITSLQELETAAHTMAPIFWKLGQCLWDRGNDLEHAYNAFITSLKHSSIFAPSFTSLGRYYTGTGDAQRATKCFQKAFELDAREVYSAKVLAECFAKDKEWELVSVVAKRVVDGEGGEGSLTSDGSDGQIWKTKNLWAYKALGVVELNSGLWQAAITSFQTVTRIEPLDYHSWIRLGEAYMKAGRYEASLKALLRARDLDDTAWMATFLIGELQQRTGQFEEAVMSYSAVLGRSEYNDTVGILQALSHAHLSLGRQQLSQGYDNRAESSFAQCITASLLLLERGGGFRRLAWKSIADACLYLGGTDTFADEELVSTVLNSVSDKMSPSSVDESLSDLIAFPIHIALPITSWQCVQIAVTAYSYRMSLAASNNLQMATAASDLGGALQRWSMLASVPMQKQHCRDHALRLTKQALRLHPSDSMSWILLGDLSFVSDAKVAQHSYIQALEIDTKNVKAWTRLGHLCLHHRDIELANELLLQAQVADPGYSSAWVGQAIVADRNDHSAEATALLDYTTDLDDKSLIASLMLSIRLFSAWKRAPAQRHVDVGRPLVLLGSYLRRKPLNAGAQHLQALFYEQSSLHEQGIASAMRCINLLETAYEDNEDSVIERQFAVSHITLGRLQLRADKGDFAVEAFETALSLLPKEMADDESVALRIQCHMGIGLAQHRLNVDAGTLDALQQACAEAQGVPGWSERTEILLSQALWKGGDKDGSQTRLLQCVESNPESLLAVTMLASIGILTSDTSLIDAALSEIVDLPLDTRIGRDPFGKVPRLLIQHHICQAEFGDALQIAQKVVQLQPSNLSARSEASQLLLQATKPEQAAALLDGSEHLNFEDSTATFGTLALRSVSKALIVNNSNSIIKSVQKDITAFPWDDSNWDALAYVKTL